MSVKREPAIRKPTHPAADLPERPTTTDVPPITSSPPSRTQAVTQEKFSEQHNVRIRPSTKARLLRAVDKLRYETGDRTISIASVTDAAIIDYLDKHGC